MASIADPPATQAGVAAAATPARPGYSNNLEQLQRSMRNGENFYCDS
jgi:hypothetical protein